MESDSVGIHLLTFLIYPTIMETPWGHLRCLDLSDTNVQTKILAADKDRLAGGLVGENLFDQIIKLFPTNSSNTLVLDVETAIVNTCPNFLGHCDCLEHWHAFVWMRSRQPDAERYLNALVNKFQTWLIDYDERARTFMVRRWIGNNTCTDRQPIDVAMNGISGCRGPLQLKIDKKFRDGCRQQQSFQYLTNIYGSEIDRRIILARLLLNYGIQPWFRAIWNLDRILVHNDNIWVLEIKHKYPFVDKRKPRDKSLCFGINNGELHVIRRLGRAEIRCFHSVFAKPIWEKDRSFVEQLSHTSQREQIALIGVELDVQKTDEVLSGRLQNASGDTSFNGNRAQGYYSIAATEFRKIGLLSDKYCDLASNLAQAIDGNALPAVTDQWLESLRLK